MCNLLSVSDMLQSFYIPNQKTYSLSKAHSVFHFSLSPSLRRVQDVAMVEPSVHVF